MQEGFEGGAEGKLDLEVQLAPHVAKCFFELVLLQALEGEALNSGDASGVPRTTSRAANERS